MKSFSDGAIEAKSNWPSKIATSDVFVVGIDPDPGLSPPSHICQERERARQRLSRHRLL